MLSVPATPPKCTRAPVDRRWTVSASYQYNYPVCSVRVIRCVPSQNGRLAERPHPQIYLASPPIVTGYRRGGITVLDRPKLETRVCECYAVVKKESDCCFLTAAEAAAESQR